MNKLTFTPTLYFGQSYKFHKCVRVFIEHVIKGLTHVQSIIREYSI